VTALRGMGMSRTMSIAFRFLPWRNLLPILAPLLALAGCSSSKPPPSAAPAKFTPPIITASAPPEKLPAVMLGIDVLEADGFAAVKGRRLGLLTHPAGVNRRGVSTIDVLLRAPGVKLVALFGAEHGIYGDAPAAASVASTTDRRTRLPVFSIYPFRRPTKEILKGIDALVIDLQDIGTRSYTFITAMKWAMEGCFEQNVEVIVLDRPNPLGGLKASGPPLDAQWAKDNPVGAFRVPYVHGLTMGELARMAKEAPGVLNVPEAVRTRGRLTVVPMRGWTRAMRWPETGLTWVPTSGGMQDWAAVQGYPMVGLGSYFDPKARFDIGFRSGIGREHIFRGLSFNGVKTEQLEKELRLFSVPGVQFQRVSALDRAGKPTTGVYIEIVDYDAWEPTALNFWLMKIACRLDAKNPFAPAPGRDVKGFLRHLGSTGFWNDLVTKGARVDVEAWLRTWREQAKIYQEQSRRYWLYR